MTNEQIEVIRALRDEGHAVVIFNSEELRGAGSDDVESRLVELGWDVIDCLCEEDEGDGDDD